MLNPFSLLVRSVRAHRNLEREGRGGRGGEEKRLLGPPEVDFAFSLESSRSIRDGPNSDCWSKTMHRIHASDIVYPGVRACGSSADFALDRPHPLSPCRHCTSVRAVDPAVRGTRRFRAGRGGCGGSRVGQVRSVTRFTTRITVGSTPEVSRPWSRWWRAAKGRQLAA